MLLGADLTVPRSWIWDWAFAVHYVFVEWAYFRLLEFNGEYATIFVFLELVSWHWICCSTLQRKGVSTKTILTNFNALIFFPEYCDLFCVRLSKLVRSEKFFTLPNKASSTFWLFGLQTENLTPPLSRGIAPNVLPYFPWLADIDLLFFRTNLQRNT